MGSPVVFWWLVALPPAMLSSMAMSCAICGLAGGGPVAGSGVYAGGVTGEGPGVLGGVDVGVLAVA